MHSDTPYIHDTITRLKTLGVDYYDTDGNFPKRYSAYLKSFTKAKELISVSSDTTTLYPLEDPRELIYRAYFELPEEARGAFLAEFNRKGVDRDPTHLRAFTDLDREALWRYPKN